MKYTTSYEWQEGWISVCLSLWGMKASSKWNRNEEWRKQDSTKIIHQNQRKMLWLLYIYMYSYIHIIRIKLALCDDQIVHQDSFFLIALHSHQTEWELQKFIFSFFHTSQTLPFHPRIRFLLLITSFLFFYSRVQVYNFKKNMKWTLGMSGESSISFFPSPHFHFLLQRGMIFVSP